MCDAIEHRGPDSYGYWSDKGLGIHLGHRRLSIIDLSEAGNQPMQTQDGRLVIVFNGEIYNHSEIRRQLERTSKMDWRGGSDTETLLRSIESFGLERTLRTARGMFAFALWDTQRRELTLSRDRIGEKPLYYGLWRGRLVFASELKSILAIPGFSAGIDYEALSLYFRYGSVPEPHSILGGIRKLRPGTSIVIPYDGAHIEALPEPNAYWSIATAMEENPVDDTLTLDAATDRLEALLHSAVEEQSISDVKLGAFLSGGIDSSLTCAILREKMNTRLNTFTIGFDIGGFDESEHARNVASHLGTDHHEMVFGERQILDIVPKVADVYCEPFSDSSQLPTMLLSRFSRESVTVSLSGDAGDELFGGYSRYRYSVRFQETLERIPFQLRRTLGLAIAAMPKEVMAAMLKATPSRKWSGKEPTFSYLQKMPDVLLGRRMGDVYDGLMTTWKKGTVLKRPTGETGLYPSPLLAESRITDMQRIMASDIMGYLCSDILVKVDRAAMAASLETRIPLLDHRIVEFAQTLPQRLKIEGGNGKPVLKNLLRRHLPEQLFMRPKSGFAVPMAEWLRTDLKEWAAEMLSPTSLRELPFLDSELVKKGWLQHQKRRIDWSQQLWNVLMFVQWHRLYGKRNVTY